MNNFESIEWTNTWFEHQGETDKKRIIIIGDSIMVGTKSKLKEALGDEYYVDMFATSRAIENDIYTKELMLELEMCKFDYIFFNHGLHGSYMTKEVYEKNYERVLLLIVNSHKESKVLLGLSTPVTDGKNKENYKEFNNEVLERNEVVKKLGKKYSLSVVDNYTLVDKNTKIKTDDGYHYYDEGYEIIAANIKKAIK